MGNATALMDWEHFRTPDSDGVQMIATYVYSIRLDFFSTNTLFFCLDSIFPKDGCMLKFSPRREE
jgi:hypothetical protein